MKIKLIAFIAALLVCLGLQAQYNNATLTGPWIVDYQDYIIFDGNGTVLALGSPVDSLHPVGTYNVFSGDSLSATLHLSTHDGIIYGALTSAITADFTFNTNQPGHMFKIANPGLLADTLSGYLYDSTTLLTQPVQFIIDSNGAITQASGLPDVAGYIFTDSGYVAGYMTTTHDSCTWQQIQIEGTYANNIISGKVQFGQNGSVCSSNHGSAHLTHNHVTTGIGNITNSKSLAIYPNPVSGITTVQNLQANKPYLFTVSDANGRIIQRYNFTATGSSEQLHLDGLATGAYLLQITTDQCNQVLKLIKAD